MLTYFILHLTWVENNKREWKPLIDSYTKWAHNLPLGHSPLTSAIIVSPDMWDFASQGLWPFPNTILSPCFGTSPRQLGENWWGSRQLRMLTWFSLMWSQFQYLVIIDYFLGKKHIESMLYALTQPKREWSNRYGTRTTQRMHDQIMSVQLSHNSPRCTQVVEFSGVGLLTH